MIAFPNAKINLGLRVVARRADGYHNIETLFYPIGLKEALEVIPSAHLKSGYRLFQYGTPVVGDPENNLVVKALKLIAEERKLPAIEIHLLKRIPSGAGLGGGSADAAAMLRLLNDSFHLDFSDDELMARAGRIGADCPFFLLNRPAYATGTGNLLEPFALDLKDYAIMVVKPSVTVSTKEAYAMIRPGEPERPLREILNDPPDTWCEQMKNDFEEPIFKKFPEICSIKRQLYEMGAIYASMSGSGAALFGIFRNLPEGKARFRDCFVWRGGM